MTDIAAFNERIFHYQPTPGFSLGAAGLFFFLSLLICYQTCKYGGRFMYIVFVMGLCEMQGYVMRYEAGQNGNVGMFIGSQFFLLVSPIALALVNYLVVGRLMAHLNLPVRVLCKTFAAQSLARFFVTSDVMCFILQASGGGMTAITDPTMQNTGRGLVVAGLVLQLCFFSMFAYIVFVLRTRDEYVLKFVPALRPVFMGEALTIALLYVRNIYRVAEFAGGNDSYVATNEWMYIAFEACAILLAFVCYSAFHFGRLLECNAETPTWKAQLDAEAAERGVIKRISSDAASSDHAAFQPV